MIELIKGLVGMGTAYWTKKGTEAGRKYTDKLILAQEILLVEYDKPPNLRHHNVVQHFTKKVLLYTDAAAKEMGSE